MSRNKRFFLVALAILGMAASQLACGSSTGGTAPTLTPIVETGVGEVDGAVAGLTEAVVTGPACAYGLTISNDVAHRLNHYRICVPESGQEQKQADALQRAIDDCFEQCDSSFPDVGGGKTEENIGCVAQCKGE